MAKKKAGRMEDAESLLAEAIEHMKGSKKDPHVAAAITKAETAIQLLACAAEK